MSVYLTNHYGLTHPDQFESIDCSPSCLSALRYLSIFEYGGSRYFYERLCTDLLISKHIDILDLDSRNIVDSLYKIKRSGSALIIISIESTVHLYVLAVSSQGDPRGLYISIRDVGLPISLPMWEDYSWDPSTKQNTGV